MNLALNSLVCAIAASALSLSAGCAAHRSAEPGAPAPAGDRPSAEAGRNYPAAHRSPGLVVHVDPESGQILREPPKGAAAAKIEKLQSTVLAPEQNLEVPSPRPGGGVVVNLDRQFHAPLVATVGSDGKIRLQHRHSSLLPDQE